MTASRTHPVDPAAASTLPGDVTSSTAAVKVYDTVELLEHIVHYLASDEILNFRLVNKHAKSLILTSRTLHKSIFTNSNEFLAHNHACWDTLQVRQEDHGLVRCHGSWAELAGPRIRICKVHHALPPGIFNVVFNSNCVGVDVFFDASNLLEIAHYETWKSEEDIIGGAFGYLMALYDYQHLAYLAARPRVRVSTLGQLHEAVTTELEMERTRDPDDVALPMILYFNSMVPEGDASISKAQRAHRLPPPVANLRTESQEMVRLRSAIEQAAKELCGAE